MDYIGTIGTVGFGILSIYFFYRSRTIKRPLFIYQTNLLQTKNHPEINIIFRKKQILNLSRTYILFCNKGRKEIRKDDIPSQKYPSIIFNENVKVLSVSKTSVSSEHNNFGVSLNGNKIEISFDYMNQNDGIVFEVLYDSDSKEIPAELVAPIIGSSNYKLNKYKTEYKISDTSANVFGASLLLGLPAIFIITNILNKLPAPPTITQVIMSLVFLAGFLFVVFRVLRDYYKYALPTFAKNYFK